MPTLSTIPNELLDRIAFYLGPLATSYLLLTCRLLASSLSPAMHRYAIAPKDGMHALHWAAEKGHLPLLQRLLSHVPVDLLDSSGRTALQATSCVCNNPLVLEHLLLQGADVNHTDHRGFTALHYACEEQIGMPATAEATVCILITHGANVNIQGHNPISVPLAEALDKGCPSVGHLLLAAGANPNWVREDGNPLLFTPVQFNDVEWLHLLLDYGADIDNCNNHHSNAFLTAVHHADLSTVELLVERGADIRCVDDDGDTPLLLAILYRQWNTAKYLIGLEGIDIISGNHNGDTPANLTVWYGHSVLRMLLENGYPVDYVDPRGSTALHVAVMSGQDAVVRTLLEKGADTEILDDEGDTPLLLAIQLRESTIAQTLIERGADPTSCEPGLLPPLMVASMVGLEKIVRLFLEKGVDVNYRDQDGMTSIALAEINGHHRVVKILAAHGGVI